MIEGNYELFLQRIFSIIIVLYTNILTNRMFLQTQKKQ
jgi:hypothetical protein